MNKYKRLLELVLLFAGGFVAGSLIVAVFTLGFRAITAEAEEQLKVKVQLLTKKTKKKKLKKVKQTQR